MIAVGLVEGTKGVVNEHASTMRATDGFLSELETCGVTRGDLSTSPEDELIILKTRFDGIDDEGLPSFSSGGVRVPYRDTARTDAMRSEMANIDLFLTSSDIRFFEDGLQPVVDTHDLRLRRYFTTGATTGERFDLGGRLFGGWWQNLKKERRGNIRIEGEKCCVLDFAAM